MIESKDTSRRPADAKTIERRIELGKLEALMLVGVRML
jgi:hypothetical protein